jgi:DNA-binding CsgD family transcriptional regulator
MNSNVQRHRDSRQGLRAEFGLTPAEAALAIEIAKGDGRKAAAARLGISVGTARTHLTRIFQKVGVRRQAELVRVLVQSGH